jgi:hypothetical protein
MSIVLENRSKKQDFIKNEFSRLAKNGGDVYIATAFFTHHEIVSELIEKGCKVYIVFRLGFPTNPYAIDRIRNLPKVQIRFFTGHSFHPKLYIFGDQTALVGSANLTNSALQSNQEIVVSVNSPDERLEDLMSIFEDYWIEAEVLNESTLEKYRSLFNKTSEHVGKLEALESQVLMALGDTAPSNINRGSIKRSKSSLFLSSFQRSYQECVSAFEIIRQTYIASGYRKCPSLPLRIEIDSFISFVREKVAFGESWSASPIRNEIDQESTISSLVEEWRTTEWPHFEQTIALVRYPLLNQVFESPETVLKSSDSELFDALCTLHSFHDRFRFYSGGLPTWKNHFPTCNDPVHTRETLSYIVFGKDSAVERMANAIFDSRYKLNEFGRANIQELLGWCNREELPIINGRTTKVLRFFGSNVSQLK